MFPEFLETVGAWVQVLGTLISASGLTIIVLEDDENSLEGNSLTLIGNGVEAFGNSIQAIGRTKKSVGEDVEGILGAWFQSAGNITNSKASYLIISGHEVEGLKLDILGDSIQSIGAFFESVSLAESDLLNAEFASQGELIQSLGAMIEAMGVLSILKDEVDEGTQIQAFGSYAQLAGATMTAIAFTKDFLHKDQQ
ncbi:DUF6944 family repetitive protein [Pseudalkalibacillus berkeleyi]|uniref:Uncharacterized protein n=1 Tax=Pseudalkalibacillus berkeleyi TaxID=1069813 RepID=A0ABS9H3F7_9BACL|nr:hypothetical protein [Pseudalkalibacillus berkeleyi]MCF6139419.1 hypothetical protein [Pseudalkalibacillus berkeleyi]